LPAQVTQFRLSLEHYRYTMFKSFQHWPDNLKGAGFLMLAVFGFALMTLIIKLAGAHLHVTQILLLRQAGMVLLVSPAILRSFPGSLRTTRVGLQLLRIAFALVAMMAGFSAIIHMPLADATAITFAKSFFVTIFAVLILQETVGVYRWGAVAVGFLGVMLMLRPGSADFSIWGLAALLSSACAGVVMIIIRLLSRTDHPNTTLSYQALGVGLVMLTPGIYFWVWPTPLEWLLMLSLAVVSYFAQKANIYAYKWGEASLLASLDYVRLLYATLFGFLVFGTFPDIWTWSGAAVVIAASVFTIYREARLRMKPSPVEETVSELT
jgi:drug/metabolite transporter (DMT)-like permease